MAVDSWMPPALRLRRPPIDGGANLLRILQSPASHIPDSLLHEQQITVPAGRRTLRMISDPGLAFAILNAREDMFAQIPLVTRVLSEGLAKPAHDDEPKTRARCLAIKTSIPEAERMALVAALAARIGSEWREAGDSPVDLLGDCRRLTLDALWRAFFGRGPAAGESDPDVDLAARTITAQSADAPMVDRLEALEPLAVRYVRETAPELAPSDEDYPFILGVLLVMLDAGHDNSAPTLAWMLWLLAHRPDLQQTIREEGAGATSEAVLLEVLRLYPPIPTVTRRAMKDFTFGNERIAKGEDILISLYAMHRHRDHWAEADAFRPERFLSGRRRVLRSQDMLPFGAGPRGCIGTAFAQRALTTITATLLSQVELRPNPDAGFACSTNFALRPVGRDTVFARAI